MALRVEVLSPDRLVWSGEAKSVRAPGIGGSFGVLSRHIDLVSALGTGSLFAEAAGKRVVFSVSGGFLEVKKSGEETLVKVLSDAAEASGDINVERARASKVRAAERMASRSKDLDLPRAQAALSRAMNRLRIAGAAD